jgi:hypothetical protein
MNNLNKIICFILCITAFTQIAADNTIYLKKALDHLEKEQKTAISIHHKTYLLYEGYQWFLLLLKLDLTENEFQQLMYQAQPIMRSIIDCGDEMEQYLYPDYLFKTIDVIYEGKPVQAFLNLKSDKYQNELENYIKNGIFQQQQLTQSTLDTLKSNVGYNYVLTLDGDFFLANFRILI